MSCEYMMNRIKTRPSREIKILREEIYTTVNDSKEINIMYMIQLYNKYFFNDLLKNIEIRVKFTDKTRVGYDGDQRYTIELSESKIKEMVADPESDEFISTFGDCVECHDYLSALQLLIEHELTHLLVDHIYCQSEDVHVDQHTSLFKEIIGKIFNHSRD